ncbi:MAG: hypothetical protein K2J10_09475 [Muribaculaceae bacterium]|nr:hypothetical protein [Muribaculaceae bacterium]
MDTSTPLYRLAADPASLSVDTLRSMRESFPYSPLPAMALLKYHQDRLTEKEIYNLRLHLAVVSGDKTALFNILGDQSEVFANIYPKAPSEPQSSTDNAIDTFFANYGTADPAETELLERMIFNPVPDYAEILLRDDATTNETVGTHPGASTQNTNKTNDAAHPGASANPTTEKPIDKQPSDDTLLSESLAKIFIKQGRYERAYEIISNLSLNYPKKSIYFADQLRFLQKLIKIKQAANGK